MRERLARGHAEHVGADRAPEQAPEAIHRATRFGKEYRKFIEPLSVLAVHRVETRVEARKGIAMSGQDEQTLREAA